MEIYRIENLTFKYTLSETNALDNLSLIIDEGEFITICGRSGCGKSTLLRQLKPSLSPNGTRIGTVFFMEKDNTEINFRDESEKIGFVQQDIDSQIVTDKVWSEIAFGLESLGLSTQEIRVRVAEMASFFGIQNWFHKSVTELSGGQKQLLNLASVMAMQPSVLILDEPTSQLDPIAAQDFLETVYKINRELGTTVILTEHRLENAFPISDRVLVMEQGRIIADDKPNMIGKKLKGNSMFAALPTAIRVFEELQSDGECPITVREARKWLDSFSKKNELNIEAIPEDNYNLQSGKPVIELRDIFFRYDKKMPDVIHNLSVKICEGELLAVVGGNGSGKSTMLSIISGINTPYYGKVIFKDKKKYNIGMLPQNPQALFVKKTVRLDLYEMLSDKQISSEEREKELNEIVRMCELEDLLERHPYDLSGGEQQRAALAKVLLLKPEILLLDEPTKGLDARFKAKLAKLLYKLKLSGVTIVLVSHDIEFCAEYADRCAMFFDGGIVSEGAPREFFSGKHFYTTAANRMARSLLPNAILAKDIISAIKGRGERNENK